MIKTKTWICLFLALLLICLAAVGILSARQPAGTVVQVLQDGTCIREIDLEKVKAPFSFVVEDPKGGSNTVSVEPGRICVSQADCPDQVCVHRGWLTDAAAPIVCIPHRLVIQMTGQGSVDSVVS